MGKVNFWLEDGNEQSSKNTMTAVAQALELRNFKGVASPSTLLQWLCEQPTEDVVAALKPLRAESLRRRATKFDV